MTQREAELIARRIEAPDATEPLAEEVERLRSALELSAERFDDLALLMDRGQMEHGGFLRASAARIRKVLSGGEYHADLFALRAGGEG